MKPSLFERLSHSPPRAKGQQTAPKPFSPAQKLEALLVHVQQASAPQSVDVRVNIGFSKKRTAPVKLAQLVAKTLEHARKTHGLERDAIFTVVLRVFDALSQAKAVRQDNDVRQALAGIQTDLTRFVQDLNRDLGAGKLRAPSAQQEALVRDLAKHPDAALAAPAQAMLLAYPQINTPARAQGLFPFAQELPTLPVFISAQQVRPTKRTAKAATDTAAGRRWLIGPPGETYLLGKTVASGTVGGLRWGIQATTGELVAVKVMRTRAPEAKGSTATQVLRANDIVAMMATSARVSAHIESELARSPATITALQEVRTGDSSVSAKAYLRDKKMRHYAIFSAQSGDVTKLLEHASVGADKSTARATLILSIAAQSATELAALHAPDAANTRFAHLDIKAENMVFNSRGWVKLIDFDGAQEVDPAGHSKQSGLLGSVFAPEMLQADAKLGQSTDVWALAIGLVEMMNPNPSVYLMGRLENGDTQQTRNYYAWALPLLQHWQQTTLQADGSLHSDAAPPTVQALRAYGMVETKDVSPDRLQAQYKSIDKALRAAHATHPQLFASLMRDFVVVDAQKRGTAAQLRDSMLSFLQNAPKAEKDALPDVFAAATKAAAKDATQNFDALYTEHFEYAAKLDS